MTQSGQRQILKFDFDWQFSRHDDRTAAEKEYPDSPWRKLDLPHDWSIEGPFSEDHPSGARGAFLPGGVGWYRKRFQLPGCIARDKKVYIQFDGIYHHSDVWVNGHHLGHRPYGYVSFQYDLTPFLDADGENVVAVRVDNSDQPNCRWYSGSGIFRHVWLTMTDKLHVSHYGTYITTPSISTDEAAVEVQTKLSSSYSETQRYALHTELVDPHGHVAAELVSQGSIPAGGEVVVNQGGVVDKPVLWSLENQALYQSRSTVLVDGQSVDNYTTPFGIRSVRFDSASGFWLNGENLKLKGVCLHHDAGALGAAVLDRALERRLEILKDLGCNAIRMSHNPPAPEMLDLCDRLGFLVIDEAFDKWRSGSYGQVFAEWWKADLLSMIERDRNHPCVVLWSVGNEVAEQGSPESNDTLTMLVDFVHQHDPSRLVTCGLHPAPAKTHGDTFASLAETGLLTDVYGGNYQEHWYEKLHDAHPELVIIGTECYPYFRGSLDYVSDDAPDTSYKAFQPSNPWFDVERLPYVAGQFLWTGIDYLGEARGWPSKGWSTALIDTCGYPKAHSHFHKSVWSSEPMVHIGVFDESLAYNPGKLHWAWPKMASHWTLPHFAEEIVRLATYTNCETVELVLNGVSQGTKALADFPDKEMIWYVPYEPGLIQAIGRNGGRQACCDELKTAGPPTSIQLRADRSHLAADGQDLCHVDVEIVDQDGVLAFAAEHLLMFSLTGDAAEIAAVDNGDLLSSVSYQKPERRAHFGRCLVIVQSARHKGVVTLMVQADGLAASEVQITVE